MWLTFAPVPSYTASYYNVSEDDVDWFSMAYFVVSLVTGFVSIYVLDTLGLKVAVRICNLLSVVYVYVFMRDCTMYAYLDMAGRTCVHVRLSVVWVYFSFFFGILPCDLWCVWSGDLIFPAMCTVSCTSQAWHAGYWYECLTNAYSILIMILYCTPHICLMRCV